MLAGILIAVVLIGTLLTVGWFQYAGPSANEVRNEVGDVTPQGVVDYARDVVGDASRKTNAGIAEQLGDAKPSISSGRTLNLSNQGLTKVPVSTFSETSIESLDISGNKLTGALQAEVRNLSNLRTLDMSDNQFTGVPAEVGQLSKLEVLDLSNNQLKGLPYELGNLSSLKVLDLRGNNYAMQDLDVIKAKLPATTVIKVD